MSKFKSGEEVYVSGTSESAALKGKDKRVFVGIDNGLFICKFHSESNYYPWKYIAKIPEKKIVPWTKDTCPALPFVIRDKNDKWVAVVNYADAHCVRVGGNSYNFKGLLGRCDYLPDPKNKELVLPCGEEVDE